ncbi:beta-1,4 N-acetylgalactosaminyltransferase 2-like [Pseudochaenichthys georgianus]|uniref:beta-1,4 N-acetylgalactosaminyltransferase 2-like n=1 Tax=Pseudochaenichthys georgianus TaxID=52239 RepID=UPI0039C20A78
MMRKPSVLLLLLFAAVCGSALRPSFKYYNETKTWREAQAFCREHHSDLATIRAGEEVENLFGDLTWIGLYKNPSDSAWKWSETDEIANFTNWAVGQPNRKDVNCVVIYMNTHEWHDFQCDREFRFLCYDETLVLVKERKTWDQALRHCRLLEAENPDEPVDLTCNYRYDLASVRTEDDRAYARLRAAEASTDQSPLFVSGYLHRNHNLTHWTESVFSTRLYAPSNSPLQYPIQGFKVRPMTPTIIPGLALHAEQRTNYTVSLEVSKGVLRTVIPAEGARVQGNGERRLMVESSSLETLNELLADVSYASTLYHIHTGDLASFQFEDHEAVFPITIKQPQPPVLYDMGTDINSQVTITTKTFLRYPEVNALLRSIRQFYKDMEVIIADDSFVTEKITGDHTQHFIMPPAQGWFAGRNLAVSQVTTKYFLWVDDDFQFTKGTNIEEMVKIMETNPELDVLGGKVLGNQFDFSLNYEEGDEMEGGCLNRTFKSRFQSLPGYPQCSVVSGVVNFFLARTDAARRVRFDPKLKRVAHSEFFMDGLGSLMVATCGHVSIGHPGTMKNKVVTKYSSFRHPGMADEQSKFRHLFFKNHLKCVY